LFSSRPLKVLMFRIDIGMNLVNLVHTHTHTHGKYDFKRLCPSIKNECDDGLITHMRGHVLRKVMGILDLIF
jgi:hypothetical protein